MIGVEFFFSSFNSESGVVDVVMRNSLILNQVQFLEFRFLFFISELSPLLKFLEIAAFGRTRNFIN